MFLRYLCVFTLCLSFSKIQAQQPRYQGQAPISTTVSTKAKPIQKQWKGNFEYPTDKVFFSNNFKGGRLNGLLRSSEGDYTALITSENTPINPSPWYAFKVWSPESKNISVTLTYQDSVKHRYYPKLSRDGVSWSNLDTLQYTEYDKGDADFGVGSLPIKVKLQLEVGPDTLWVAGQELETSKEVFQWVDKLSEKKFVAQKTIGKSSEGRDLKALRIGKEQGKNMLMIISRQHPPEVTGYLAMKSFVEALASDSKLAKRFRKKFTAYVVPLMNPDGVDNGHWRHNAGGVDLNRDWAHFNQPETAAVKRFMADRVTTTGGKFYFGIDFHSTWDDIYYTLDASFEGNMPGLVPEWLAQLQEALPGYAPNIRPSDRVEPTTVSRNHFFVAHGAEALVFEIGDNTPRPFIKEKGEAGANILMQLLLERLDP